MCGCSAAETAKEEPKVQKEVQKTAIPVATTPIHASTRTEAPSPTTTLSPGVISEEVSLSDYEKGMPLMDYVEFNNIILRAKVIEKRAVDHEEHVDRLSPAVKNQGSCQKNCISCPEISGGNDVIQSQCKGQEKEYEDDAAK